MAVFVLLWAIPQELAHTTRPFKPRNADLQPTQDELSDTDPLEAAIRISKGEFV